MALHKGNAGLCPCNTKCMLCMLYCVITQELTRSTEEYCRMVLYLQEACMVSGLNSVKCVCVHCVHQSVLCLSTGVSSAWVMGILMCWFHTLEHPVTGSYNAAFTFRVHICMLDPAQIGNSHSNLKVQNICKGLHKFTFWHLRSWIG